MSQLLARNRRCGTTRKLSAPQRNRQFSGLLQTRRIGQRYGGDEAECSKTRACWTRATSGSCQAPAGRLLAGSPTDSSVPIPKFAFLCGTLVCELRNPRDTSKSMTLVRFLDLKFLHVRADKL